MHYTSALLVAFAAFVATSYAAAVNPRSPGGADGTSTKCVRKPVQTCLSPEVLQTASFSTGQEEGTEGLKAGQSPSDTDQANFINFCAGRPLTNGRQTSTSSCNSIVMGNIPARANMISSIITSPQPGARVPRDRSFNVTIQTSHLRAGFLVNPTVAYYTAPQQLDDAGDVIGHCHITVQDLGGKPGAAEPTSPPDPTAFAYFKGVDDQGDGKGGLRAEVSGGLAPGYYRVCSMIAARNHQPVVMPVAQRGAQDDCVRFEVV